MPVYIIVGPAVALIGIGAVFFVLRHKSVQTKSMYSSRRSQFERKVRAARQRTLAPSGRGNKPPTEAEIAAAAPSPSGTIYEAPAAPARQAWDAGPAPAPVYTPPAYTPPAYAPPAPQAPSAPAEPSTPTPSEPAWTPTPIEPSWTPGPAAEVATPATPAADPVARAESSAGEGASWSIVADSKDVATEAPPPASKGKKKKGEAAGGSSWSLASGEAPSEGDDSADVKTPSAAMAVAQYAVLVVGLVMVLIGVLVMVANQKVT